MRGGRAIRAFQSTVGARRCRIGRRRAAAAGGDKSDARAIAGKLATTHKIASNGIRTGSRA